MKIKLVKITKIAEGCPSFSLALGEEVFVTPNPYASNGTAYRYRSIDHGIKLYADEVKEITGIRAWLRCLWKTLEELQIGVG